MNDCNETPVQFGSDGSLIGVIATPGQEPMAPVACLLLNMGANHRIGPRRINVKLARQLAAHGISSIRMDLAGLGDSRASGGTEHFRTQAVLDLQAAMNLMGTMLGVHRFMVIGLCSGAQNGLSLGVADKRVVGLLMFDGYVFPGRRSRLERKARRALAHPPSLSTLIGKVTGMIGRRISRKAPSGAAGAPDIFETEAPEDAAAFFCRSMNLLTERNVATMSIYTGTLHVTDHGRDQLGPYVSEPFASKMEYRFIRDIDHSLISMQTQQTFMSVVCDWALRVIQGNTPASGASASMAAQTARAAVPRQVQALAPSDP